MPLSQFSLAVGLGSPHGDDRVGWEVIDRLAVRTDLPVAKARDGTELLQIISGRVQVLVIDAAAPSGHPGRMRQFEWPVHDLHTAGLVSTHGLGVVEALQMAQTLGCAPQRATVITIEADQTDPLCSLSDDVERSIDRLVECLINGESPG